MIYIMTATVNSVPCSCSCVVSQVSRMLSAPRNAEYPIIALFVVPDAFPGLVFLLTLITIPTSLIEESLRY